LVKVFESKVVERSYAALIMNVSFMLKVEQYKNIVFIVFTGMPILNPESSKLYFAFF